MAGEADQAHGQPGSEKCVTSMDTSLTVHEVVEESDPLSGSRRVRSRLGRPVAAAKLPPPVTFQIDAPPTVGRSLPAWPTARPLRAWQQTAAAAVFDHSGDAFLASATPAAGKTTFGLHVAHRMLAEGRVARVAVIAPTTHICRQWALDAARYGIRLEPNRPNSEGPEPRDRHGVAVTYATVAAGAAVHRRRCAEKPTLLIADEPHHMGEDATWGRTTVEAFARARFRLLLSGTPFRSDNSPIPWVSYDDDGISSADYDYGYTQALVDNVCRPVTFHTYGGDMEWVSDGKVRRADFDVVLPAQEAARRLRTALDPEGDWITHVLQDAHAQLLEIRGGRAPGRGRPGRRDRQGARGQARRPARADHRRAPGHRALRRGGRLGADRALLGGQRALARLGPDGLRRRRRPAPARGRVRDDRADRALLPPGDRALHPPHAGAEGPDVARLPAVGPEAQAARGRDRGGAQPRARVRLAAARRSPSAASAPRPARPSARCGRARGATRTCCRPRSPATRCSSSPSPSHRSSPRSRSPRRPPLPAEPETAFERRERLRAERHTLVGAIARRTGEAHAQVNAPHQPRRSARSR